MSNRMNCLVVGYGSIGSRHARILGDLGCGVAVVSQRDIDFPFTYSDLSQAVQEENPEYVVIANSTHCHFDSLAILGELGYSGKVLVEKPLFDYYKELPNDSFKGGYVAYNLRFHPVIQRLRSVLQDDAVVSVQAYVGQYLPDWRPGSDYRESYSAKKNSGGGVLRDLSHELDYLSWIFGEWKSVTALGGHLSQLEITSDDIFTIMMATSDCPIVSVQMNYLDRVGRRYLVVNTAERTLYADLVKGELMVDRESEAFSLDRDFTYKAMHKEILSGNTSSVCTFSQGLDTLRLIESIEKSARETVWLNR